MELDHDGERLESLDNMENLRPVTPTGCLVDSDPDLLIASKPTSPAVEEVERPLTPGKGIVAELGSEDSADEVLSLSPTISELFLAPPGPFLLYQDMPRTPGREDTSGCVQYTAGGVPATAGSEMTIPKDSALIYPPFSSPAGISSLSRNPYVAAPKTPGRDIILPRRSIVHKRLTVKTSHPRLCDEFLGVPSPCSLSESSSDTADGGGAWISSGVKAKPLQGLENIAGLLDDQIRRDTKTSFLRQKQWKRQRRRWKSHQQQKSVKRIRGSLFSRSRRRRWRRSVCEERRILHSVWTEGLDEEDARLLQSTYERLQEQDDGFGWLSDTLWIPHPHILLNRVSDCEQCFRKTSLLLCRYFVFKTCVGT